MAYELRTKQASIWLDVEKLIETPLCCRFVYDLRAPTIL
jgi:hypothetical protein